MNKTVDYMNLDELENEIYEILHDTFKEFMDDKNINDSAREYLEEEFRHDVLVEEAVCHASDINSDMRKYLHQTSHFIPGNLMDVELNYKMDHNCGHEGFVDMVKRLDAGDMTEKSKEDREWLRDWFWEAFGTFGLSYNFQTTMNERWCEYEAEYED